MATLLLQGGSDIRHIQAMGHAHLDHRALYPGGDRPAQGGAHEDPPGRAGAGVRAVGGLTEYAKTRIFRHSLPPLIPLVWVGSARQDLRACPAPVQRSIGKALLQAQRGEHAVTAKRLKGDLAGLVEIVDDFDGNTYRAVYTSKLTGAIYVLHVFQKKATHGIATPKHELDLIKARLRRAREHHAAQEDKET